MNKRIKIALITLNDANDKKSWSGTLYNISKSLQEYCGDVYYIEPFSSFRNRSLKNVLFLFNYLLEKIFKKGYVYTFNQLLCKNLSRYVENNLEGKKFDLIFAPAGSSELAFLNTKLPVVYLSDSTFNLLFGSENRYIINPLDISLKEGNYIEKLAIDKSDMIIYSSKWAADSAIGDYSADESKIHIVPFGANIEEIPSKELVNLKKKENYCNLLFLGVDWKSKGGEIVFETLLELENYGFDARLTVCGCTPPKEFFHEKMEVIPFLDKNDEKQSKQLFNLFFKSDFLFLPTRNDAFGIVFCEANAFGLPVITTDTGGVSGVIEQGKNGFMLPLSANASDYAKLIHEIFLDDERYKELVNSSRKIFDKKLNWDSWGLEVSKLIYHNIIYK